MIRDTSDIPSALTLITDDANREGWCTTPFCTTCESQTFQIRLCKITREE